MSRKTQRQQGKDALDLLEETIHLLRRVPGRVYATYYVGSASFVLAFLYFWADMSRGISGRDRLVGASLLVALLFLWMKCWQAVFASRIRSLVRGGPSSAWPIGRVLRLFTAQAAIQPAGLLVLPLALLLTLPFGWVYAYYQNVTLFGDGEEPDLKSVTRKARVQATLFPKQNHAVIAVLTLFGLFVFLNIATLLYFAPQLLHLLTGVETDFSRASWHIVNTTFLAASVGMTYLALDPIVKCVYVLRCFYGESILTGEDLEAEMRNTAFKPRIVGLALVLIAVLAVSPPLSRGTVPVSSERLDRSISEVVAGREYAWRMPQGNQDAESEAKMGPVAKFIIGAADTIRSWLRPVKTWIRNAAEWLIKHVFSRLKTGRMEHRNESGWPQSVFFLFYGLMAAAASLLAVMAFRVVRRRVTGRRAVPGEQAPRTPDLTRQDITADELPANRWLELGRELMRTGDVRLALRAYYLACLSRLAEAGRITIAACKSNREYERELGRRAHAVPGLLAAFSQNVSILESAWYGMHDVSADALQRFIDNQERIMAHAQEP